LQILCWEREALNIMLKRFLKYPNKYWSRTSIV